MRKNTILIKMTLIFLLLFFIGSSLVVQTIYSKELITAREVDAENLDPQYGGGMQNHQVTINIFEPLIWTDKETGELIPVLAESWENIDDYTWEFKLRQGVEFHNGAPFNAEAVKFSFDRIMDPDFGSLDKFPSQTRIEKVEIIDDYTVRIITEIPVPILPRHLTRNGGFILEPGHYEDLKQEEAAVDPIGTGPFKFVNWRRDERIELEAFEGYWRGPSELDKVIFRTIPESGTRIAELTTGGVHIINNVPFDSIDRINSDPDTEVRGAMSYFRWHFGINQDKHPALKDPLVRKAIQHAVHVDRLIEALRYGLTERMATMVNPPNHHPDLEPFEYNPELARELLVEAGYPDGFSTRMGASLEAQIPVAIAVAQDLGEVGIKIEPHVEVFELGVYYEKMDVRDLPGLYVMAFGGAENTSETDMWAIHPDRQDNSTNWFNQEWYDIYEELSETFDPDKRQELSYRLQEILHEENPWLWLWREPLNYGVRKNVVWEPRADEMLYYHEVDVE